MTKPQTTEYTVRVRQEEGSFWAEVVELPGCFASGFTLDELRAGLEEAISMYVSDDPEAGKIHALEPKSESAPHAMIVEEMRVAVPC